MKRLLLIVLLLSAWQQARAQVDVEHRRTLSVATGVPVVGQEQLSAFGYYWFNEDHCPWTNTALRVIFSGIYADSELSYFLPGNPNTAIGAGLGGGLFLDSIFPYQRGNLLNDQAFFGDNGNGRLFLNQTIPNPTPLPLNLRATYAASGSFYRATGDTQHFVLPDDFLTQTLLAELRFGGIEPGLTATRGAELYLALEANYRSGFDAFGPVGALFPAHSSYQRAYGSLAGKIPIKSTVLALRLGGGLGEHLDELSAWKLGGNLIGVEPFAYALHGYYTRELFAEDFGIANADFSFPIAPAHQLTGHLYGDWAVIRSVPPEDTDWHNFFGVGAGLGCRSFWNINWLVSYGYGVNAVRHDEHGGHEVGLALEKQF